MIKFPTLSFKKPEIMPSSKLYDENTFYTRLFKDLKQVRHEVIIESPFVTNRRMDQILPLLEKLKKRKVRIVVNTKDPNERNEEYLRDDTHQAISSLQHLGVQVIYTTGHHRKLVILDRTILYEGSLNVLSQNNSREVMRRIESAELAWQMARFVKIDQFIG